MVTCLLRMWLSVLCPWVGVLTPNFGRYMCRGKVKNWQGLRNELPVERENGGLRNELEPFWAWKWGVPKRAWSVLAWKWDSPELPGRVWLTRGAAFGLSRPWEAMNGFNLKKFWKLWSPERQNPQKKNVKWSCSGTDFFEICEDDMLRNGNSGLKMGVSLAAHTQYAYIWKYPPPPPGAVQSIRSSPVFWRLSDLIR